MTPTCHPDEEDLLAYATGRTPEWQAVAIACHLTYCPPCRRDLELFDELGGSLLDALPSAASVRQPTRGARPPPNTTPQDVAHRERIAALSSRIPRPLHHYIAASDPRWQRVVPGVRRLPLALDAEGGSAAIVKFRKGFVVPEHTHAGDEILLILDGELGDTHTGRVLKTGDISRSGPDVTHLHEIGPRDACIALTVNLGELLPTSWWGRVLKRVAGV